MIVTTTESAVWQASSELLTRMAWQRFAIKRDRHGIYSPDGGASWSTDELTEERLRSHFTGELTLGCGSTSIDDKCLWVAWDLDNHVSDTATNQNLNYAVILMNRLAELGGHCIIEHSDGKGGIHVWLLFSHAVPSDKAHHFAKWVARDYQDHLDAIECFPKSPSVQHTEKKCGTYLRLPGKHHKREHWSQLWGDGEWLDAEQSIELLLTAPTNNPLILRHTPPIEPPKVNEYTGPQSDSHDLIRKALPNVDPNDYGTWIKIGQALHSEDDGLLNEWIHWSESAATFKPGECEQKWKTFTAGNGVSIGTLFHLACEAGWIDPRNSHNGRYPSIEAQRPVSLDGIIRQGEGEILPPPEPGKIYRDSLQHDRDDPTKPIPFEGIDVVELEQFADEEPDWIINGLFSADQPTLFGARSKCLKTTQLIDMSVALASGTLWLQSFEIARPRRVLFITGESNRRAASRRIRKACRSRDDLAFSDITGMLRVEAVNFPKLPSYTDCEHIRRVIDRHHPDVVIIDPLYRGLTMDIDPHKMNQVGDAIVYFSQCCQPASLFISHHVIKASARELGSPPELEDMAGAGIAESCGNWWLVGRVEKYQWDWKHDLCVQFGGRDEQCGARRIIFNESTWTTEVENFSDFIGDRQEAAEKAKDEVKRDSHQRKIEQARARIRTIMRNKKKPHSKRAIEDLRGAVPQTAFREAFADMVTEQTIAVHSYQDSQNRLQSEGYLLAEYSQEYERRRDAR